MSKSLTEAISIFLQGQLRGVYTALPGVIDTYDAATCKASVIPLTSDMAPDGTVHDYPIIVAVPVMFPRTSKFSFTYPLTQGDSVLLVFSGRSLDEFLASSGTSPSAPADPRVFDLTDAIAIPGLFPFTVANPSSDTESAELNNDNKVRITMKPSGDLDIYAEGAVTVDGSSISLGKDTLDNVVKKAALAAIKGHTHPVSTTGTAVAQTGTAAPSVTAPPLCLAGLETLDTDPNNFTATTEAA